MQTLNAHTINPYIRTAIRSVLKSGTTIKQRIIFDYELLYVEKGEFVLRYGGSDYTCKEGQFLLIHPGISHSFQGIAQDLSQPHIHFDLIYNSNSIKTKICFQDRPQLSADELLLIQNDLLVSDSPVPFITFSNMEQTKTLFYKVIDQSYKNDSLSAKAALVELIGILITDNFPHCLTNDPQNVYDISQQIKDFIDSAHGIHISLNALEKQFSYSKFYLEREFKKKFGIGLIAYSNDKKMEYAYALLGSDTVSNVAELIGFSSIYSFSRSFKNKFGFSPSKVNKI